MLEPLAAARAAADAAPCQPAGVKSAAAANVPPPLLQQQHAILTVQAMLAVAEAAADAFPSDGAQQVTDPVAEVSVAEIAAAAVRQVVPALMAYLQAAPAAIPRQPQPPHQACSHSVRNQPAAAAATAIWWQPPRQLGQRRAAPRRIVLSGSVSTSTKCQVPSRSNRTKQMHVYCCAVHSLLHLLLLSCQLQALLQTCHQLSMLHHSDCCPSAGSCELQRALTDWLAPAACSCRPQLRTGVSTM
jgi:hypothetical protein